MRKNTQQAFEAWRQGKSCKPCRSVWTNGSELYSYGAIILYPAVDGKPARLNSRRYSVTTTVHQRGVKQLLDKAGITYTTFENYW